MAISKITVNKIKFKDLLASGGTVNIDNIHDNIIYTGHYANSIKSTIGIPSIIPGGTYDVVVTFIVASWRYQLMMCMFNGNIIRRAYRNGAWTDWALVSTTSVGG